MFSNFGSRLSSLRRAMTGEEVDDPDNEDCSYVSNALRQYYTDKGRQYPSWLPPDPKGKIPTPQLAPQLVTSHSTPTFQGYGSQPTPSPIGRQGGGLGDLWNDSRPAGTPQAASLRRGKTPQNSSNSGLAPQPFHSPAQPSERPSTSSYFENGGGAPAARAPTAQERLRARLHGTAGKR
ncbi:hypothetical protein KEM55_009119 [Ascosphaera atra]|nr:hypothetical protein KEM55_009119 [Ascosphaera atra]